MNDILLHEPSNPINRKKKASHNDPHTTAKRIRLNAAKFADYCSASLRHAVETPFQAYADECQMTSKHLSSQTMTSSTLPHGSKLNDKLIPTSDNCQPFINPGSASIAYRTDICTLKKSMGGITINGHIAQCLSSVQMLASKCIGPAQSLVIDNGNTVVTSSHYQDSGTVTNDSSGGNKSEPVQSCFSSKLLIDTNAVIELKPLFPSLHPPETVTTCSASILTSPTSVAGHFYRCSVQDIRLPQPSDSSHYGELDAKPCSVVPLIPDSAVDATSEPKSRTVSKLNPVVPSVGPVHTSQLNSSMPNDCERFPRSKRTGNTLSGRHMEYENTPSSVNRFISVDNKNIEHGSLGNFYTKSASASSKQSKSIKYRRTAYSEKLKLRCSN